MPTAFGVADIDECLVEALPHDLFAIGVKAKDANLSYLAKSSLIHKNDQKVCESHGLKVLDVKNRILLHLTDLLKQNAQEFLSIHETKLLCDRIGLLAPNLLKEVVPKLVSLNQLTDILKRLLSEQVSIKDMKTILQSLAEKAHFESNNVLLTEYVRKGLSRYLCFNFGHGQNLMRVILLSAEMEDIIRTSIIHEPSGSYLALEPILAKDIQGAIKKVLAQFFAEQKKPVLLTSHETRRYVKKLIELDHPNFAVLSLDELAPNYQIQAVGSISLEQKPQESIHFDELFDSQFAPAPAMH